MRARPRRPQLCQAGAVVKVQLCQAGA
eukprot:SAG22_NODE_9983_length_560_cov_0.861171_2_plen_26_part_01